jgi:hypothetical protein
MFGVLKMINTLTYQSIHKRSQHSANHKRGHMTKQVRIYSLRLAAVAVVFVILFLGFAIMQSHASGTHVEPAGPGEGIYMVSTGDTLWEIANVVEPGGKDRRKVVYDIKVRNGLESSSVKSGQTLIIPETYSHSFID